MYKLINNMDKVEIKLIKQFFNLDLSKLYVNELKTIHIGESDFYSILEFYKFEYKECEKKFWNDIELILTKYNVQNEVISLHINYINMPYIWFDYITKIYFDCSFKNNILFIKFDKSFDELNIHYKILNLICLRQFLTDIIKDKNYNILNGYKKLNKYIERLKNE